MNLDTKELITWWMQEAKTQSSPFISFFIYYMCLDAWMTAGSTSDRDADKLKWLIEKDNPLRSNWNQIPNKRVSVEGLVSIGTIEDMRPNRRGEFRELSDTESFEDIIYFIYQIRCNLFHGGKSPVNQNDYELVSLSGEILKTWLEWSLLKTNSEIERVSEL